MIVLPSSIVLCFGEMIGNRRRAWVLYGVMSTKLVIFLPVIVVAEQAGTPLLAAAGIETSQVRSSPAATWKARRYVSG